MSNLDHDGEIVNPISRAEFDRRVQALVDIGFTEEQARANQPPVIADSEAIISDNEVKAGARAVSFTFTPFKRSKPKPRDWLHGMHYIRKYVTADISPGGGGKTSEDLVEAVAMATGVDLLKTGHMYTRPLRVGYWNGEDPREEVERRLEAIIKHYSSVSLTFGNEEGEEPAPLQPEHLELLARNLHIDTGRETLIKLAREDHSTFKMNTPLVESIVSAVIEQQIDVVIIDPFVSSHSISENDNVHIDRVIKDGWVRVAEQGNCGVNLVHHTRKVGRGAEYTAADARGASAIVDAARDVRVFNPMSEDDAKLLDVAQSDRWRYFRIESDKPNMAARGGPTPWRCLMSVDLGNAADSRPSDNVGVVVAWEAPQDTPEEVRAKIDKLTADILARVDAGERIVKTHGGDITVKRLAGKLGVPKSAIEAELDRLCDDKVLVYRNNAPGGHGEAGYYRVDNVVPFRKPEPEEDR